MGAPEPSRRMIQLFQDFERRGVCAVRALDAGSGYEVQESGSEKEKNYIL